MKVKNLQLSTFVNLSTFDSHMHSCPAGVEENSVESENDLLSIGEECEEWPVQKVKTQTHA